MFPKLLFFQSSGSRDGDVGVRLPTDKRRGGGRLARSESHAQHGYR